MLFSYLYEKCKCKVYKDIIYARDGKSQEYKRETRPEGWQNKLYAYIIPRVNAKQIITEGNRIFKFQKY